MKQRQIKCFFFLIPDQEQFFNAPSLNHHEWLDYQIPYFSRITLTSRKFFLKKFCKHVKTSDNTIFHVISAYLIVFLKLQNFQAHSLYAKKKVQNIALLERGFVNCTLSHLSNICVEFLCINNFILRYFHCGTRKKYFSKIFLILFY